MLLIINIGLFLRTLVVKIVKVGINLNAKEYVSNTLKSAESAAQLKVYTKGGPDLETGL